MAKRRYIIKNQKGTGLDYQFDSEEEGKWFLKSMLHLRLHKGGRGGREITQAYSHRKAGERKSPDYIGFYE